MRSFGNRRLLFGCCLLRSLIDALGELFDELRKQIVQFRASCDWKFYYWFGVFSLSVLVGHVADQSEFAAVLFPSEVVLVHMITGDFHGHPKSEEYPLLVKVGLKFRDVVGKACNPVPVGIERWGRFVESFFKLVSGVLVIRHIFVLFVRPLVETLSWVAR